MVYPNQESLRQFPAWIIQHIVVALSHDNGGGGVTIKLWESQQSSNIIIQYYISSVDRIHNNKFHTIKPLTIPLILPLLSFLFHTLPDQVRH